MGLPNYIYVNGQVVKTRLGRVERHAKYGEDRGGLVMVKTRLGRVESCLLLYSLLHHLYALKPD